MTPSSEDPKPRRRFGPDSPHVWVLSTYFAEGFPYGVVNTLAEALFKEFGASLQAIGLTALFHLPWNLKFLWGPFLDAFSTKRKWLIACEVVLSILLVILAFTTTAPFVLTAASVLFLLMAIASATHDIAIDGYYLEGLDADGQSEFVGYRAAAWRGAALLVAGPLLVLTGRAGWWWGLMATAAVMGALLAYHTLFLPRVETPKKPIAELLKSALRLKVLLGGIGLAGIVVGIRAATQSTAGTSMWTALTKAIPSLEKISTAGWIAIALLTGLLIILAFLPTLKRRVTEGESFYAQAFVSFLDQPYIGRILAFVILFRAGESFLLKMRYPFLRDAGLTMEDIGWISGTMGVIATMVATLVGGRLISKQGLHRWIWPFVIAQNVLNLLYAGAAFLGAHATLPVLATVIALEAFGAGLGTAVFMVYLMRCCRPDFKAAHMAILTALMSIGFTFAGVMSGFLADAFGYGPYFAFTFLATIPAMALIPFLPHVRTAPA